MLLVKNDDFKDQKSDQVVKNDQFTSYIIIKAQTNSSFYHY